ncbi:hypothetical protein, partial [Nitrosopumilus sp. S6]
MNFRRSMMSLLTFFMIIGITFSFPTIYADSFEKEIILDLSEKTNSIDSDSTKIHHVLKLQDSVSVSNPEKSNPNETIPKTNLLPEKTGIVEFSDGIFVSGNDELPKSILHLKYDSDKKTSKERISNFEKISFDGKSIQILEEEIEKNSISIFDDDLITNFDQNNDQSLVVLTQENDISFLSNYDLEYFTNTNFLSQHLVVFDNSWDNELNIFNPTLLLLLAPVAGVVLISSESNKNVLRLSKRTQSFSLVFLLLFSATSTPFMISDNYWGNAYAEEFSFEGLMEDASFVSNSNSTSAVIESNSTSAV